MQIYGTNASRDGRKMFEENDEEIFNKYVIRWAFFMSQPMKYMRLEEKASIAWSEVEKAPLLVMSTSLTLRKGNKKLHRWANFHFSTTHRPFLLTHSYRKEGNLENFLAQFLPFLVDSFQKGLNRSFFLTLFSFYQIFSQLTAINI